MQAGRGHKDIAPFLKGEIGRYLGAGAFRRFHHQGGAGQAGDYAVSFRESPARRIGPGRIFRNQAAAGIDDAGGQRAVGRRIDLVDAAAQDGHGRRAAGDGPAGQGAAVSRRVDAARQTRHHHHAGGGGVFGQTAGQLQAGPRREARTDHGQGRPILERQAAADVEQEGRPGRLA